LNQGKGGIIMIHVRRFKRAYRKKKRKWFGAVPKVKTRGRGNRLLSNKNSGKTKATKKNQ